MHAVLIGLHLLRLHHGHELPLCQVQLVLGFSQTLHSFPFSPHNAASIFSCLEVCYVHVAS